MGLTTARDGSPGRRESLCRPELAIPALPDSNIHSPGDFERAYVGRDWRAYRWLVAVCVEYGEPGLILDVGAGLGFFVEACKRYGLPCVGLEGSQYAVEAAHTRYPIDIHHHYLSQPLPFRDNAVAVVVLNQTLEHLTPPIAGHVLRESFRVLSSGGLLAIYSPCRYDRTQTVEPTHINLHTPKSLRAEVLANGFVRYRAIDSARTFGKSRLLNMATSLAFRCTGWSMLSASANCLAYKQ